MVLRDAGNGAVLEKLTAFGNATVAWNVKIVLRSGSLRNPIHGLLEQVESAVNSQRLQLIGTATVPLRWVPHSCDGACRATVANRLNIDSLHSPNFPAKIPVFSSATLATATHPAEWLPLAIREADRALSPVAWTVEEPAYLAGRGLLDGLLQVLAEPAANLGQQFHFTVIT